MAKLRPPDRGKCGGEKLGGEDRREHKQCRGLPGQDLPLPNGQVETEGERHRERETNEQTETQRDEQSNPNDNGQKSPEGTTDTASN